MSRRDRVRVGVRCGPMDGSSAFPSAATFRDRLGTALADLAAEAERFDHDGADPIALCAPIRRAGLLRDSLPRALGGEGLCEEAVALHGVLVGIGAANLSAARLYEGHVNAVKLVHRYGRAEQMERLAADVNAGAVCGVWNAEGRDGLRLQPSPDGGGGLVGGKIFASGIGCLTRPLVTARRPDGGVQMVLVDAPAASDVSGWTARGMRATATGSVDLTGVEVGADALVGAPGDYYRSPLFKGGAWRFAAAQAGAILRIQQLLHCGLAARGRESDAHQRARAGQAALAAHTAQMWTLQAARMDADPGVDPAEMEAFAGLARLAVETTALEVIGLAERSLGLSAFLRPDPLDRVIRDLSTYLRQPFPDAVLDEAAAYVGACGGRPPWSALPETIP